PGQDLVCRRTEILPRTEVRGSAARTRRSGRQLRYPRRRSGVQRQGSEEGRRQECRGRGWQCGWQCGRQCGRQCGGCQGLTGRLDPPPPLTELNASARALDLRNAAGCPVRFVAADDSRENYELRTWRCGEVPTRLDNWHDAYNAAVWLEFPLAKA